MTADQDAMARGSGFDEVEIDDALALHQPEDQWRARADWRAHDYRARLGARHVEASFDTQALTSSRVGH